MSSENTMMAQISLCRNGPSRSGNVRAGRLVCALPIGASVAGWCASHGITNANYYYWPCRVRDGTHIVLPFNLHIFKR